MHLVVTGQHGPVPSGQDREKPIPIRRVVAQRMARLVLGHRASQGPGARDVRARGAYSP